MREKLETLPVTQLRELAKAQGLKVSSKKKSEIIDLLCSLAEKENMEETAEAAEESRAPKAGPEKGAEEGRRGGRSETRRSVHGGSNEEKLKERRTGRGERRRPEQRRTAVPGDEATMNSVPAAAAATGVGAVGANVAGTTVVSDNGMGSDAEHVTRGETRAAGSGVPAAATGGAGQEGGEARRSQESADVRRSQEGGTANGILEVMADGFGFIRSDNFLPGENDIYVPPMLIKKYNLKTGDIVAGITKTKTAQEKFAALLYINTVNGLPLSGIYRRPNFENLTPIFPNQRIRLENQAEKTPLALRVLDLLAPIGKGQRGMIVSPPKAGKTTLLKQVAKAILKNDPKMHLMILLIDERPEEVTDMKEEVYGSNVEVIYSTFDELPERHKRVSEMVVERAKRLVEQGQDVTILLDSITRLARAYNLVVPPSGRTLSGGLDPAALHMPKRFFGAARNMREGGSLTILATALIDTGSRMDDVIYEEFKGTGNMELVLDRKLQERRIFPAIDILKSGTRRDDLLLSQEEKEAADLIHKVTSGGKADEVERILDIFDHTQDNREFCETVKKRFMRYGTN